MSCCQCRLQGLRWRRRRSGSSVCGDSRSPPLMALVLAADGYWDLCSLSQTITFASVGLALQETGGGCVSCRLEGVAVKNTVNFFFFLFFFLHKYMFIYLFIFGFVCLIFALLVTWVLCIISNSYKCTSTNKDVFEYYFTHSDNN